MTTLSVTQPPTEQNPLLSAALAYTSRYQWDMFPLHHVANGRCSCRDSDCTKQGKHPRTQHGFLDATTKEAQIRAWWTMYPNANLGRPTGKKHGVVVLDVDPRHGGLESLAELEAKYGSLDTLSIITGSGGTHYHFLPPETLLKSLDGTIAPGLDTKAEGGYVILPPSNHLSGSLYRWGNQRSPAPVPDWLLALWPKLASNPQRSGVPPILGDIVEGNRDKALTSWAGSMRKRGMSEGAILAALRYENETRCKPPLPDKVIQQKAHGMNRYELGAPAPIPKHRNFKPGKHSKVYLPTVTVEVSR
jgi:putative DNA primase/helicase